MPHFATWEICLLLLAAFLAINSLTRLMRQRRVEVLVQLHQDAARMKKEAAETEEE